MGESRQIRQAMGTLGVDEDTIRRWRASGLLCAGTPLSGVRRFRGEDGGARGEHAAGAFASLHEDDDVVVVRRSRSVD